MTKEEALTIYNEIPNYSSIFPSNLYGENKYNKKVSQFCQFIGFTADIYNKSSRFVKTDRFIAIYMIAYKGISPNDADEDKKKYYHKGYFANFIKKITDDLNTAILIYLPFERIKEIGEKQGWLFLRDINCLWVPPKIIG